MLFPKNKIRFTKSYQGKDDPDGWIVLDFTGVETDGLNKVYVSLSDIETLRRAGDVAAERLRAARALLGGDPDET